jgi:hypothetical protein
MRYAAVRDPASLPVTTRVLAIPAKRFDRPVLGYLTREQVTAILAAPDRATWSGQRDAALFAVAYNTGARVSELISLQVRDVLVDRQTALLLLGKGRKQRVIPLWTTTAAQLRAWLTMISPSPQAPVFPNGTGIAMTRSSVRDRLDRAVTSAQQVCPSRRGQHVSPHTLRQPAWWDNPAVPGPPRQGCGEASPHVGQLRRAPQRRLIPPHQLPSAVKFAMCSPGFVRPCQESWILLRLHLDERHLGSRTY